jgi:hypothetical protein
MAESGDRIDVVFGARVGELVSGVNEVKEKIESISGAASGIISAFSGVGEALAAAFAVERIAEFANKMAELGERTEIAAAAVGISAEEFSKLSVEMQLLTGQTEINSRALTMLGSHIVEAVNNPASRAARAVRDLGISQRDLQHMLTDTDFALRRLSQAFTGGEIGWARTADFSAIIGRRLYESLIPALKLTSEQWDEVSKKAQESGAILSGPMIEALAESKKHINELSVAWSAFERVLSVLTTPAVRVITSVLTTLVNVGSSVVGAVTKIGDAFKWVFDNAWAAGEAVGHFLREMLGLSPMAYAAIPPIGGHEEDGGKKRHLLGPQTGGAKGGTDDRMSIWRDALRQQLQDEQNFLGDSKKEELAYWQAKLATVGNGTKEDLKLRREVNAEIFNLQKQLAKEQEQIAIEEQTYQQKVNDGELSARRDHLQSLQNLGKITAQDRISSYKATLDEELKADEDYYHKKEQAAQGDLREITKLEQQEYLNHQRIVHEKAALDDQAREQAHSDVKDFLSPITSAISNSAKGVAMGTQTFGQAGSNIGKAILSEVIDKVMGKLIDKLIVQTITNLLEQLAADAANTGILATLLGLIFAKPEVLGTSFAGGGIVSAAGGWQVPSTGGLARLHKNEMVLPEHISVPLQNMIAQGGMGGGGPTINIHAIDTQSGAAFLMQNGPAIAKSWRSAGATANWSPRSLASTGRFP